MNGVRTGTGILSLFVLLLCWAENSIIIWRRQKKIRRQRDVSLSYTPSLG